VLLVVEGDRLEVELVGADQTVEENNAVAREAYLAARTYLDS
jgi:hypothetical protein